MTAARRAAIVASILVLAALVAIVVWLRGGQPGAGPEMSASPAVSSVQPSATRTSTSAGTLALCGRLPVEVDEAVAAVRADGPYLRPRVDGQTFGNRERLLPRKASGYYREYTVEAPGARFPGPRRLITGGQSRPGAEPEIWFYSADHYESFCELRP